MEGSIPIIFLPFFILVFFFIRVLIGVSELYDPALIPPIQGVIETQGYHFQMHLVRTDDSYVLLMFRIITNEYRAQLDQGEVYTIFQV